MFYGGLGGLIVILIMIIGFEMTDFETTQKGTTATSQTFGFLIMFIALSLIFFGMRRYRNIEHGGVISFGKALLIGLAMSMFAGIVYVIIAEIYLATSGKDFIGHYTDMLIRQKEEAGASADELAEFKEKMKGYIELYMKPWFRWPITFTEIFPVGVLVSLFSALVLHNPKFWARKL